MYTIYVKTTQKAYIKSGYFYFHLCTTFQKISLKRPNMVRTPTLDFNISTVDIPRGLNFSTSLDLSNHSTLNKFESDSLLHLGFIILQI